MKVERLTPNLLVPVREESVVDFWESVTRGWPQRKYDSALVDDLDAILKRHSMRVAAPVRRILDCGCGTGNPSIGLHKKGYEIFGVDADRDMVTRFRQNCREAAVEIPVITYDWRNLNNELLRREPFDAAICRGNSLIYAGCWDRPFFIPQVAADAISTSLRHIGELIRAGGLLYVDMTSAKEYENYTPKTEYVGVRETPAHRVFIHWTTDYDLETRTRRAHGKRVFESTKTYEIDEIRTYTFTSYMLFDRELKQMADDAGFDLLEGRKQIESEKCYDVYLFVKRS